MKNKLTFKSDKFNHFFDFFNVPSKPVLGVDITPTSIRMVELSKKRNGSFILDNYLIENISSKDQRQEFFIENDVNVDLLAAYLAKAAKKLGSNIKNIAIALPNHVSIVKTIKLSADLDEDGLAESILEEAPQYIPFPVDEIFLDWHIVNPEPSPENENDILICASRSDLITNYMAAAEKAGLKVSVVDIETYAKNTAFSALTELDANLAEETVAFIDVTSSHFSFTVYQNGEEVHSKEIPFGHNQLNEMIQNIYDISPEKAEESRKKYGEGLVDFEHKILIPYLESLSNEINRTIQFFLTQATVDKIDQILIAGFSASLPNSYQTLSSITQIPTKIINPFAMMDQSAKVKKKNIERDAPLLFTAFGLAHRRFD